MDKKQNDKPSRKEISSVQSMLNNLKTVQGNRYGAMEAKFYISSLKEKTGRSEQSLLPELIINGFAASPAFAPFFDEIKAEWETIKQKQ